MRALTLRPYVLLGRRTVYDDRPNPCLGGLLAAFPIKERPLWAVGTPVINGGPVDNVSNLYDSQAYRP